MGTASVPVTRLASGGRRLGGRDPRGANNSVHIKWIAAFETGNPEIDALHRKLIQDCCDLLLLVEANATWPLIVAEATRLVESCLAHFRSEELLLERTGFPRRREHWAEHRRMERALCGMIDRMKQVDGSLMEHRDIPRSIGPYLVDIMIRHDLDFRSHLLQQKGC